jgi:hypothetical protein
MTILDATLADQIAEVKREVRMRQQVYGRMVRAGSMSAEEAAKRTLVMAAVQQTLEGLLDQKRTIE